MDAWSQETEKRSQQFNKENPMAIFAGILGVVAIICTITVQLYGAIVVGAMAIILASLSRGEGTWTRLAKRGFTCGIIAVIINIVLLVGVIGIMSTDNVYHDTVNSMFQEVYGSTFDDMINSILSGDSIGGEL